MMQGQPCISTTWVLTDKEGQIKGRLVAQGFEESETFERDSPTVVKSTMRLLYNNYNEQSLVNKVK